jgi:hypothetical protein
MLEETDGILVHGRIRVNALGHCCSGDSGRELGTRLGRAPRHRRRRRRAYVALASHDGPIHPAARELLVNLKTVGPKPG